MKCELEKYILNHSDPEGDYLYRLYRATNIHTIHGRMASGHLQGRLLKMLVMMQRPHYILEVGTFSGYSAICMAEGLKSLSSLASSRKKRGNGCAGESGKHEYGKSREEREEGQNSSMVFTFEINDEMEDFTRPWIENSPVADFIDFRIGDAMVEAPKLGIRFDMAFLDSDKRNYVEMYDTLLPLMTPGAIILADNTLWDGHVADSAYDHDQQTQGIRRFNDYIRDDVRVEKVILPMRDGLSIIRVKP